ncbi:hypothetical protein LG272_11670 [Pseudidiomarina marina]|uniref:hypothetical protein n=1 Tax=Pseudidiomarina marina TaxID=502366 RepID=UPI00384DFCEF
MITNNLLFSLRCEWNRWANQRGKLSALLIGFAVTCVLTALSLYLGGKLFFSNPHWVQSDERFYTLSMAYEDGRQSGISRQSIDYLHSLSSIDNASWLMPKRFDLQSSEYQLNNPLALVFDDTLISLLDVPFPKGQSMEAGVWLSERFWKESFAGDSNVIGSYLTHPRIPTGIQIKGILPASIDSIGPWQPDVWLPSTYLQYTTPFSSENAILVDRFLRAMPEYYGIFTTNQEIDVEKFTALMNEADLSVSGMSMQATGAKLKVYEGIQLDYPATQAMITQWQILVLLVVTLAVIFALSTIMIHSSRSILFQQELNTFQILGARFHHFIQTSATASVIQLIIIAILSIVMLLLLSTPTLKLFGFTDITSTVTSFELLKFWLSAFCLVALIFSLCSLLPLTALKNRMLFSRMVGTLRSRSQLILGQVNLISQITVALVALSFSFSLIYTQFSNFHPLGFNAETVSFDIKRRGGTVPLRAIEMESAGNNESANIAFSTRSFNDAVSIANENISNQSPPQVDVHYVSANYFDVIQAKVMELEKPWKFGVVINRSAAKQLAKERDISTLIGAPIELGKIMGRHTITGIVNDIAHTGRFSGLKPTAYLLVDNDNSSDLNTVYMSSDVTDSEIEQVQQSLASHLVGPKFSSTNQLADSVWRYEQRTISLVLFSVLLVLIISLSISVNISYQVKMRLALEQHEYGLLRAIGAPETALFSRSFQHPFIALAISMLLAVCLFAGLKVIIGQLGLSLLPSINGALLATGLLLLIILLSASVPTIKLIRKPISELLKTT